MASELVASLQSELTVSRLELDSARRNHEEAVRQMTREASFMQQSLKQSLLDGQQTALTAMNTSHQRLLTELEAGWSLKCANLVQQHELSSQRASKTIEQLRADVQRLELQVVGFVLRSRITIFLIFHP